MNLTMKYLVVFFLSLNLYHVGCYLNSTKVLNIENFEFSKIENEVINDILSSGNNNAIFLTSIQNVPCPTSSCEIYSPSDIERNLIRRGQLYDSDLDDPDEPYPHLQEFRTKNAGSRKPMYSF